MLVSPCAGVNSPTMEARAGHKRYTFMCQRRVLPGSPLTQGVKNRVMFASITTWAIL